MARPPLNGAPNETVSCPFPTTTVGFAGAVGTVLGIVAFDAGDDPLGPFTFVAVTVHVYDFPFDRPSTTICESTSKAAPATPPFDDVHTAS